MVACKYTRVAFVSNRKTREEIRVRPVSGQGEAELMFTADSNIVAGRRNHGRGQRTAHLDQRASAGRPDQRGGAVDSELVGGGRWVVIVGERAASTLRKLYATPWNPWALVETLDKKTGQRVKKASIAPPLFCS